MAQLQSTVRTLSGLRLQQDIRAMPGDWIEIGVHRNVMSATALLDALDVIVHHTSPSHNDVWVADNGDVCVRQWRAQHIQTLHQLDNHPYRITIGKPINRWRQSFATVWIAPPHTVAERYRVDELRVAVTAVQDAGATNLHDR